MGSWNVEVIEEAEDGREGEDKRRRKMTKNGSAAA
jgi:hypothetical protein